MVILPPYFIAPPTWRGDKIKPQLWNMCSIRSLCCPVRTNIWMIELKSHLMSTLLPNTINVTVNSQKMIRVISSLIKSNRTELVRTTLPKSLYLTRLWLLVNWFYEFYIKILKNQFQSMHPSKMVTSYSLAKSRAV